MDKPKQDILREIADLAIEPVGIAHALNLLLLAIGKNTPAVGVLLDEFTAMHAAYLAKLQTMARESDEHLLAMEDFSHAAKRIYQRLSTLDAEQSEAMRAEQQNPANSLRIH